jgi:hypothetical protein
VACNALEELRAFIYSSSKKRLLSTMIESQHDFEIELEVHRGLAIEIEGICLGNDVYWKACLNYR